MSRLLKPRNHISFNRHNVSQISSYDRESGLGFIETVLQSGPMRADWVWRSPGGVAKQGLHDRNSGTGASSLRSMAIRSVSANASLLSPEVMETVPWVVARDVWKELKMNVLDNLHVWKAFAVAYASEPEGEALKFRKQVIQIVNMYLEDYVQPITAPSFEWITFLTLTDITCSRSELINMSQLTNLGALTVGPGLQAPDDGVDDSILRCWARASAESKAFSKLKVLACRSQGQLTTRTFEYVGDLKPLSSFILEQYSVGGSDRHHAGSFGWKRRSGNSVRALLAKYSCRTTSWDSIIKALYTHGGCSDNVIETDNEADDSLPILDMSLGGDQKPAIVDVNGKLRLNCFSRSSTSTRSISSLTQPSGKKRSMQPMSGAEPSEKRQIKKSRQTQVENAFSEFGI